MLWRARGNSEFTNMPEGMRLDVTNTLFADFVDLCHHELVNARYTIDPSESSDAIALNYFRVQHRRIQAKPRRVRVAKDFVCPPYSQSAFDTLRLKAETGDDLGLHQHKDFGKADFDDSLLNDWGIHHLHLSTVMRGQFVERSGPLLFARITDNEFYCIKIMMHGRGHNPWPRQELLEIIYQNWPHSIGDYQLKDSPAGMVVGLEDSRTDEEIAQLRKAGINVPTQRQDGTIHLPVGGGAASDKTSMIAAHELNRLIRQCGDLETTITQAQRAYREIG